MSGHLYFNAGIALAHPNYSVNTMKQTIKPEQTKRSATVATECDDHVDKMIADIVKLEPSSKSLGERLAEGITNFTGSLTFVWIHIVWFSLWIILDLPWWGFK